MYFKKMFSSKICFLFSERIFTRVHPTYFTLGMIVDNTCLFDASSSGLKQ